MNQNFAEESLYMDIINHIDASFDFTPLSKSLMIKFLTKTYEKYETTLVGANSETMLLECAQRLQMILSFDETQAVASKLSEEKSFAQDLLIKMLEDKSWKVIEI